MGLFLPGKWLILKIERFVNIITSKAPALVYNRW
jgi:hypothetical protein